MGADNPRLDTPIELMERGLVNNSTKTSFTALAQTSTKPATVDASGDPTSNKLIIPGGWNLIALTPFGTDLANETFDLQVNGWARTSGGLWTPHFILRATCTLGAVVGSGTNELLADTIVVSTTVIGATDSKVVSPANDLVGCLVFDALGFELIEIDFDLLTGAGMNTYFRRL